MYVKVINGDIEAAMKKLKRALHDDGLIKEVLQRRYFEKPSVKRRRLRQESIRNQRQQQKLRESTF